MVFEKYLSQNLNWLMSKRKLSANELGRNIVMPSITIHKLRSGEQKNPTVETLYPIARYFDLTIHELVCENLEVMNKRQEEKVNLIPLIKWEDISSWSQDPLQDKIVKFIRSDYPSTEHTFCFVQESDNTSTFEQGVIVIVDKSIKSQNKDYVIASHQQNESVSIKKVIFDDELFLQSLNTDLQNKMTFNYNDYSIIGVIVSSIKYFRNI